MIKQHKKCPKCNGQVYRDIISGMVAVSEDDQQLQETEYWFCDNCEWSERVDEEFWNGTD